MDSFYEKTTKSILPDSNQAQELTMTVKEILQTLPYESLTQQGRDVIWNEKAHDELVSLDDISSVVL